MTPQTTTKLLGLAIVILCILATPKQKEQPMEFDSEFLKEAENYEHLIEFRDENVHNTRSSQ